MSRICTYLAFLLYSLYLLYVVRYLSYVKITQLLQSPRKKLLILNFTLPKDHCPFLTQSAVFPRQEPNISSQLGKLPTLALYLQPLNLAPAVQAQALSPTNTMTLPPALAPIPIQHTAPSDPGEGMQS